MITEVIITEGDVAKRFAQYCPAGQTVEDWLKRLLFDVLLAPANMRIVDVSGVSWRIDRANITSVTVTRVP